MWQFINSYVLRFDGSGRKLPQKHINEDTIQTVLTSRPAFMDDQCIEDHMTHFFGRSG